MSDLTITQFFRPVAGRTGMRQALPSMRLMLRTYLTRQALLQLTPRERADIAVSASDAMVEVARLPWDVAPGPRRRTPGIIGAIQHALERARTRRLIARLTASDLRDIGVSPSQAQLESAKYVWQV